MPDMKEMGFMLVVLLVSVSAIYEWATLDDVLSTRLGISEIRDLNSTSLRGRVTSIGFAADNVIDSAERADLVGFLTSFMGVFAEAIAAVMTMAFGWSDLVTAIFVSIGLEELGIIFIAPLMMIELVFIVYFFRDIFNSVRGVG